MKWVIVLLGFALLAAVGANKGRTLDTQEQLVKEGLDLFTRSLETAIDKSGVRKRSILTDIAKQGVGFVTSIIGGVIEKAKKIIRVIMIRLGLFLIPKVAGWMRKNRLIGYAALSLIVVGVNSAVAGLVSGLVGFLTVTIGMPLAPLAQNLFAIFGVNPTNIVKFYQQFIDAFSSVGAFELILSIVGALAMEAASILFS